MRPEMSRAVRNLTRGAPVILHAIRSEGYAGDVLHRVPDTPCEPNATACSLSTTIRATACFTGSLSTMAEALKLQRPAHAKKRLSCADGKARIVLFWITICRT